jgi:hypothetical protein
MTRLACVLVWRKWQSSTFRVPKTVIERRQLGAQIHNGEVHETATCDPTVLLSRSDHARSKTRTLHCGIDCEQAEVPALASQFHVDAAGKSTGGLDQQELSRIQKGGNFFWVGAIADGEKTLRAEGSVHQTRNVLGIFRLGSAGLDWFDARLVHDGLIF